MTPLDLRALRDAVERGALLRYRHFWGHRPRGDGKLSDSVFSQWWPCRFEVDDQVYVTAEQFMMAEKARLFGDEKARAAILAAESPATCKKLGRAVQGFEEARWVASRFDLVTRGNLAKFDQDDRLRSYLLDTGAEILVEASPTDRVWGIGIGREDARARDPLAWQGANLLGFALVRVRGILRGELPAIAAI